MNDLRCFGSVWDASGTENFFGQGWSYHEKLKRLFPRGFDFTGMTFVAKTTTYEPRKGNMPFDEKTLMNEESLPRCIVVTPWSFLRGAALNAVGLSGPGLEELLKRNEWQKRTRPFFISYAPQGTTKEEKARDTILFAEMLNRRLWTFKTQLGLQLNVSCPNTGEAAIKTDDLVEEAFTLLDILQALGIPIVIKLNILMPAIATERIANHPACAGVCISNTFPWEELPSLGISRKWLFGSNASPLKTRGFTQNGGLSGKPLLPFVARYIREARNAGITKPINGGGGILGPKGVRILRDAGANSISLGSITFLRPWRLQETIQAGLRAW